jgi:hypothetical protein
MAGAENWLSMGQKRFQAKDIKRRSKKRIGGSNASGSESSRSATY